MTEKNNDRTEQEKFFGHRMMVLQKPKYPQCICDDALLEWLRKNWLLKEKISLDGKISIVMENEKLEIRREVSNGYN